MRIRKLLLIHPSRSTRALIKKYVYSELSDIEFHEADCGRQALESMDPENFDVIISTDQLKDMDVTDLKAGQKSTRANQHTPLIIISESESRQARNELVEQGFDRVVQIRIRPAELIHKINALCNPRDWRRDTRYHIPGMQVTVAVRQAQIPAFLINISMGGLLVELNSEHPELLMTSDVHLTLQIPGPRPPGPAQITGLRGKLLRLEVIQWQPDLAPAVMRTTYIFQDLKGGPRDRLAELLQMARDDKLAATEVQD
jgi:DNA-binding response OmpR family regulator